jgi:hypothetical protein
MPISWFGAAGIQTHHLLLKFCVIIEFLYLYNKLRITETKFLQLQFFLEFYKSKSNVSVIFRWKISRKFLPQEVRIFNMKGLLDF